MVTKRKVLLVVAIVLAGIVALAAGVPVSTLALIGMALICPAAMYFGMGAMGKQEGCHNHAGGQCHHADANDAQPKTVVSEHGKAA